MLLCNPDPQSSSSTISLLSRIEGAEAGKSGFEAAPDGLPAGFAVALPAKEAARAGQGAREVTGGVEGAGAFEDAAESVDPAGRDDFGGGSIQSGLSDELPLQQSRGQPADQANDGFRPVRGAIPPLLDAAAGLQAFVIFFDQWALFAVLNRGPGQLKGRGVLGGQPDPTQRVSAVRHGRTGRQDVSRECCTFPHAGTTGPRREPSARCFIASESTESEAGFQKVTSAQRHLSHRDMRHSAC